MPRRCENGFTLIEVLVVTAIVAIVAGTLGTFFLAGASPAVASAARDIAAAFDEARRAAVADDAATVTIVPATSGTGYRARIFRRFPGDGAFAPRNGPAYESTVTIAETAAPLGAPGIAFAIDSSGTVTGFTNFTAGAAAFASRPCPASGAFVLRLTYERDVRNISIPCELPVSGSAPLVFETPPPAAIASPFPPATCPATVNCTLASVTPPAAATCPSGYDADPALPGACVLAPPSPAPTSIATPAPAATPTPAPVASVLPPPPPTPAAPGQIIEQLNAIEIGHPSAVMLDTEFSNGVVCSSLQGGCTNPDGTSTDILPVDFTTWACANPVREGNYGQWFYGFINNVALYDLTVLEDDAHADSSSDAYVNYGPAAYCPGFAGR